LTTMLSTVTALGGIGMGNAMDGSAVTSRPAPFFLGEHLAMDFLNTVASPWGESIEWIGSGRDLLDWLERAGLVSGAVATRFGRTAEWDELDRVARRARVLREWFREFVGRYAGRPLAPGAVPELARLNQLLARDEAYRQLEAAASSAAGPDTSGPVVRWRAERRLRTPEALLLPLAEAMGDFVCRAAFQHVRRCERCTLWFLDVSRGHGRRWCSMAICGNRAKAANYRARGGP
jgi:predicted RNA-binding Zn ribbon-like protein